MEKGEETAGPRHAPEAAGYSQPMMKLLLSDTNWDSGCKIWLERIEELHFVRRGKGKKQRGGEGGREGGGGACGVVT